MSKLQLPAALAQEGFSATLGAETVAVQLEGGKSRTRRVQLGAAALVNVQWFCTASQYDYLMAFYRARAGHGSLSFTLDLILDRASAAEYSAKFVPGTLGLEVNGTAYIVSAQLEVIPLPENTAADLGRVLYREAQALLAQPAAVTLMHASLSYADGQIISSGAGWHGFYSTEVGTSFVATWRMGVGAMAIAGLYPYVPAVDGADPAAGALPIYASNSGGLVYLPPASGYVALGSGLWQPGDQFTVIFKDGYVYYFRTLGDSEDLLAAHPAAAGNYRFAGILYSSKITDIKFAII